MDMLVSFSGVNQFDIGTPQLLDRENQNIGRKAEAPYGGCKRRQNLEWG